MRIVRRRMRAAGDIPRELQTIAATPRKMSSASEHAMHDAFNVWVRPLHWSSHEPPVTMDLGGRLPQVGDVIEVPIGGRPIRARVTQIHSPERQTRGAVHDVYADEIA